MLAGVNILLAQPSSIVTRTKIALWSEIWVEEVERFNRRVFRPNLRFFVSFHAVSARAQNESSRNKSKDDALFNVPKLHRWAMRGWRHRNAPKCTHTGDEESVIDDFASDCFTKTFFVY